jgi:hypothetical protein
MAELREEVLNTKLGILPEGEAVSAESTEEVASEHVYSRDHYCRR